MAQKLLPEEGGNTGRAFFVTYIFGTFVIAGWSWCLFLLVRGARGASRLIAAARREKIEDGLKENTESVIGEAEQSFEWGCTLRELEEQLAVPIDRMEEEKRGNGKRRKLAATQKKKISKDRVRLP